MAQKETKKGFIYFYTHQLKNVSAKSTIHPIAANLDMEASEIPVEIPRYAESDEDEEDDEEE